MATTRTRTPAKKNTPEVTTETVYGEREDGCLAGNLTFDPELHFTSNGRAVANCQIAINDKVYSEETKKWEEQEPEYFRINMWGTLAENVCENLRRGDRVVAVGFFQERTYTDKEGERQTVTEFTARELGPSMLWKGATIKNVARSRT